MSRAAGENTAPPAPRNNQTTMATQAHTQGSGYDLVWVDFKADPGTTLVPVEAGVADNGNMRPRWLPVHRVRCAGREQ